MTEWNGDIDHEDIKAQEHETALPVSTDVPLAV